MENYQKEKLTIDLVWANRFALLLIIPILLLFGLPYFLIWQKQIDIDRIRSFVSEVSPESVLGGVSFFFAAFLFGIVAHELIHGLTWALFTQKGFKSLKFGILWKTVTPYCHCMEPLKVWQYITGAVTPAIVLGIVPSILAIILGKVELLVFGMFFTLAAGGDFLIITLIRKENRNDWVQDHPSEAGCYIYRKR